MNRTQLIQCLDQIDVRLNGDAEAVGDGPTALVLLNREKRTSLDIDVGAPYCRTDLADFEQAARTAGLSVNALEPTSGEHVEWVPALRLCLPPAQPSTAQMVWSAGKLRVSPVWRGELIARKSVRYCPTPAQQPWSSFTRRNA